MGNNEAEVEMSDAKDLLKPAKGAVGFMIVYDCDRTERIVADLQQQLTEANRELSAYKVWHDELQKQLDEANRRGEELVALLKVAKCPNNGCDNNGTIPHQVACDEWEPEQCQWCDEKATATSKRGGE